MAALATIADVEARIGRPIVESYDMMRVTALLDDASSIVRMITGRPFGDLEVTRRLRVRHGVVNLGARDITAVTSVTQIDGTELDVVWDGLATLSVGTIDRFDMDAFASGAVDVTFTRSGPDAPQWVKAIVAQMAARAFGRPADQTGLQQESIAGYSYSVGQAAAAGGIGMLPQEEARLREAFPKFGGTAWVGLGCR